MARRVQLVARALGLVVALLCGQAHAQTVLSQFPPNPGILPGGGWKFTPGTTFGDPPPPRAWVNGTYGGVPGVKASDALTLRGPAGNLAVTVARSASLAGVGAAVARCLGNPVCMAVSTAGAAVLADAMAPARVYPEDAGGLRHDPGVPPQEQTVTCYRGFAGNSYLGTPYPTQQTCYTTVSSAVEADKAVWCAGFTNLQQGCGATFSIGTSSPWRSYWYLTDGTGGINGSMDITFTAQSGTQTSCPASIDPLNHAYSIPAGEPVGPDGRCKTARYNHVPITADAAGTRFSTYPPGDPAAAADRAVKAGETIPAAWEPSSGPASQQGPAETSTETGPNGTITTTKTPTYTYNYGGDTITYNQSWTTIVNNNGQVTTTVTNPPPVQSTEQDPTNPCTQNPDAAGCQKLDVPTGDNLPTQTVNVSATPDSGWGSDSGTCPGVVHTSLVGDVDPFGLVCTYMSGIRFAVIGFAGIMAALILLGRIE